MLSFGAGLQLGAVLVAFVAAVLGGVVQALLPYPVRLAPAALIAIAVLLRELGVLSLPIPENRRLVPEDVQHRGRVLGPVQFGFEMGTGMRTYSPSALPHLVLITIVLVVPFPGAILAGVGFATARFIMPVVSNAHGDDGSWAGIWEAHRRPLAVALALATVTALATGVASW